MCCKKSARIISIIYHFLIAPVVLTHDFLDRFFFVFFSPERKWILFTMQLITKQCLMFNFLIIRGISSQPVLRIHRVIRGCKESQSGSLTRFRKHEVRAVFIEIHSCICASWIAVAAAFDFYNRTSRHFLVCRRYPKASAFKRADLA